MRNNCVYFQNIINLICKEVRADVLTELSRCHAPLVCMFSTTINKINVIMQISNISLPASYGLIINLLHLLYCRLLCL